jgi:Domain of unknown function (DUF6933)
VPVTYICLPRRLQAPLHLPPLVEPGPTASRLGNWYATDLDEDHLIVLSEHSRLVVIVPFDPFENFRARLVARLADRVCQIQAPPQTLQRELDAFSPLRFATAPDRSLRTSLDAIRQAADHRRDNPQYPTLETVAQALCETPVRAKGFRTPVEIAAALLADAAG